MACCLCLEGIHVAGMTTTTAHQRQCEAHQLRAQHRGRFYWVVRFSAHLWFRTAAHSASSVRRMMPPSEESVARSSKPADARSEVSVARSSKQADAT